MTRIGILESQADGVPHPYMWYHPVGLLHHRVMGVYHRMRGSLLACQNALSADGNVSAAVSDISDANTRMHRLIYDVWRTGYRR